jgi:hypothetical protein
MAKTLVSALAAATFLLGGMLVGRAAAMPPVAPAAFGTTAARAAPVQEAAVVCGGNGCAPVQTSAKHKRKFIPLGHG